MSLPLIAGRFSRPAPVGHFRNLPVRTTPSSLTLGTALECVDAGPFTVTRSSYGPGQRLPSHAHDLASAMMLLRSASRIHHYAADIVIEPKIAHIRPDQMNKAKELFKLGYESAEEKIDEIKNLIMR